MSRKRARHASPSAYDGEPMLVLLGGEPCPSGLVELWRAESFCDVRVQAVVPATSQCFLKTTVCVRSLQASAGTWRDNPRHNRRH